MRRTAEREGKSRVRIMAQGRETQTARARFLRHAQSVIPDGEVAIARVSRAPDAADAQRDTIDSETGFRADAGGFDTIEAAADDGDRRTAGRSRKPRRRRARLAQSG